MSTELRVTKADYAKSTVAVPVLPEIESPEMDDVDKHLQRYLFFAGFGSYADEMGLETGAYQLNGILDGSRYCGHNVLASRALVPVIDTPCIVYGGDRPDAYKVEIPMQQKVPNNVRVVRSAKECAADILSHTKIVGAVELSGLKGRSLTDASIIFRIVLPADFSPCINATWDDPRNPGLPVGGEANPLGTLVKLMDYLDTTAKDNIEKSKRDAGFIHAARLVLNDLVQATNKAYLFELNVYNQCDADMITRRQTGKGKRAPDERDLRFSRDLELTPPDMKQVAEMAQYGQEVGAQSAAAIERLGEIMSTRQTDLPAGVMEIMQTNSQLLQTMAAQNAFLLDYFKRKEGIDALPGSGAGEQQPAGT